MKTHLEPPKGLVHPLPRSRYSRPDAPVMGAVPPSYEKDLRGVGVGVRGRAEATAASPGTPGRVRLDREGHLAVCPPHCRVTRSAAWGHR